MGAAAQTGLGGNSGPVLLDNSGKLTPLIKKMLDEVIPIYFKEIGGCDYEIKSDEIKFGYEPGYMYENLIILSLNRRKEKSYIQTGHAFGPWGSGIRSRTKYYEDYKRKSQFIDLIDKWWPIIFPDEEKKNKLPI